jgi:hypothetical protein
MDKFIKIKPPKRKNSENRSKTNKRIIENNAVLNKIKNNLKRE